MQRRTVGDIEPWTVAGLLSHREVIDALPGAVVVTDPDGRILLWSAEAEQLYDWPETEVLGRSVLEVLAPAAELAANRDDLAFVASGNMKTGDRLVARRDGTAIRVNTVTRPLVDGDGNVVAIIGWSDDVTALRLAEQRELAAIAVESAERERLHRERLELLGDVNDALASSSTLRELMTNVTRTAVPRLGDWCTIHVLPFSGGSVPEVEAAAVDPAMVMYAGELRTRFPYDPDARFGVARVIRTGETEFHPDITGEVLDELDATDEVREVIAALDLRSTMAVALRKRGRILGALQFAMSSASRRYTGDDVALARSVAARIASSIENLRLYEQQREIARTLQRSLLPASLPTIPGIEVAVRYWPAGEGNDVGGDFYDVFPLDSPGQWSVVIGDVCGTGPSAAALTGLARHSITRQRLARRHPRRGVAFARSSGEERGDRIVPHCRLRDPRHLRSAPRFDRRQRRPPAADPRRRRHVDRRRGRAVREPCSGSSTTPSSHPRLDTSRRAMWSSSTPMEQPTYALPTAWTCPKCSTSCSVPYVEAVRPRRSLTRSATRWRRSSRSTTETTTSPSSSWLSRVAERAERLNPSPATRTKVPAVP